MTHLGTYEAGSSWAWTLTLNDQDGSPVDLKSGGDATVLGFVERKGAIYLNDQTISLSADPDGNPVSWAMSKANSAKLPAGEFVALFQAERF